MPEDRLPASWKPRATPFCIQRAIVPQQEAGAGAACPAGCMDTRGHSLPWGPRGADASRSRRRGPRPRCGPRQREWRVQRPAGQCAPCTEQEVLQGTQGPSARARPWVPAEPESWGAPQSRQRIGPPAHGPARLGQCSRLQAFGSTRIAAPQRSGETAPIHPPQRGPPQGGCITERETRPGEEKRPPRQSGSPWGSLCPGRTRPAVPQPVLPGPHPGARASPDPCPHPPGQHTGPVACLQ